MPHYFFHVHSGDQYCPDHEGGDFDDNAAAASEALLNVRDLVIEAVKNGTPVSGLKVDVAREDGTLLSSFAAQHVLH